MILYLTTHITPELYLLTDDDKVPDLVNLTKVTAVNLIEQELSHFDVKNAVLEEELKTWLNTFCLKASNHLDDFLHKEGYVAVAAVLDWHSIESFSLLLSPRDGYQPPSSLYH